MKQLILYFVFFPEVMIKGGVSIFIIPGKGMSDTCHVSPDLMGFSRKQLHFQKRNPFIPRDRFISGFNIRTALCI